MWWYQDVGYHQDHPCSGKFTMLVVVTNDTSSAAFCQCCTSQIVLYVGGLPWTPGIMNKTKHVLMFLEHTNANNLHCIPLLPVG